MMLPDNENIVPIAGEAPAATVPERSDDDTAADSSPAAVEEKHSQTPPRDRTDRTNRNDRKNRNERPQRRNARATAGPKPAIFTRVVAISWSAAREPIDDLFWAEAMVEGDWTVVRYLDRIRSRKELLERILDLKHGLVALDFNFGFPTDFYDFLAASEGVSDWQSLLRAARNDLKKNMEDGLRLWVERLGRYRESRLDSSMPRGKLQRSKRYDDWGWNFQQKSLAPHEQRSIAQRFRRTDYPLRNAAGENLMSTMQIGYNRLTRRYEFNGNIRGRGTVLGLALLDQLLEADRKDLAIWPMMKPRPLTIVESLPWLFTGGKDLEPAAFANLIASYEDAGWDIPSAIEGWAERSTDAQRALRTLFGILKTERRLERRSERHRPIREYSEELYRDPQVQREGWIYGLGYRPREEARETVEATPEAEEVPSLEA